MILMIWEVRDVQNVAEIFVDPNQQRGQSFSAGWRILHVLYTEVDKTLAGVAAFLSDPWRPIEMSLRVMMTAQSSTGRRCRRPAAPRQPAAGQS
jgi:type IV secretion system protein VirD4